MEAPCILFSLQQTGSAGALNGIFRYKKHVDCRLKTC